MIYCIVKTAPKAICEIKKVGLKKWIWFVFYLNRNIDSLKLDASTVRLTPTYKLILKPYCWITGSNYFIECKNRKIKMFSNLILKQKIAKEINLALT